MFSNQCEPVYNLSYYILPEERALQILMENKGDYAKV